MIFSGICPILNLQGCKHISEDADTTFINNNLREDSKTIEDAEIHIENDIFKIDEPPNFAVEEEELKKIFEQEEKVQETNSTIENIEQIEPIEPIEAVINDNTKKKRKYNKKKS